MQWTRKSSISVHCAAGHSCCGASGLLSDRKACGSHAGPPGGAPPRQPARRAQWPCRVSAGAGGHSWEGPCADRRLHPRSGLPQHRCTQADIKRLPKCMSCTYHGTYIPQPSSTLCSLHAPWYLPWHAMQTCPERRDSLWRRPSRVVRCAFWHPPALWLRESTCQQHGSSSGVLCLHIASTRDGTGLRSYLA